MTLAVTSYSLLDNVQTFGHNEDWQRLLTIYQPASVGYFLNRGLQPADAEDLAQEFWTAMARGGLHHYDPSKGRFRPWLFTCLHHAWVRYLQRLKDGDRGSGSTDFQRHLEAEPDSYVLFDSICSRNAFEWAQQKVQSRVERRDWKILMRMEEGKESAEALAAEYGISPHTVREIRRLVRDQLLRYYLSAE